MTKTINLPRIMALTPEQEAQIPVVRDATAKRALLARILAQRQRDLDPMTAALLPRAQDLARTIQRIDDRRARDVLADESVNDIAPPPLVHGGQGRNLDESAQALGIFCLAALLLLAWLAWRLL